ncbi:MAG: PIN domain-containing protein [Coriobacteriales bacterium]|nr:PIN domain-containing protein [Coriobacteriales bacterium]
MSDTKVFIDTNVLVYSLDSYDPARRSAARKLLVRLRDEHVPVISTQVLQEFYYTATRKLGITAVRAKELVKAFTQFETVSVEPHTIMEAIDISVENQISFWDALIIAAAVQANCREVYTEDLNDGQTIRGIHVRSPFVD